MVKRLEGKSAVMLTAGIRQVVWMRASGTPSIRDNEAGALLFGFTETV